jgi:hypothetical protein
MVAQATVVLRRGTVRRNFVVLACAAIALAGVAGWAQGANKSKTTVNCCNFASGHIGDDADQTYFLIGRITSPKHSCEKNREYDVTFEKESENIDKSTIGSGVADSRGIVAWPIPNSQRDFDPDAYYRVKATTTPKCKSAQGQKTSGF